MQVYTAVCAWLGASRWRVLGSQVLRVLVLCGLAAWCGAADLLGFGLFIGCAYRDACDSLMVQMDWERDEISSSRA